MEGIDSLREGSRYPHAPHARDFLEFPEDANNQIDFKPIKAAGETQMTDRSRTADGIHSALLATWRAGGNSAVAADLEEFARLTGQNTFRHFAAVIRGRSRGGRPVIDDSEALMRIAADPSRRDAIGKVAPKIAGPKTSVASVERRLRRKRQKEADIRLCPPHEPAKRDP